MSDLLDDIDFNIYTEKVGDIGIKNYGYIYILKPNLDSYETEDAKDMVINSICEDERYEDRLICKCINYQKNKPNVLARKECESLLNDSICGEINQYMICEDRYCINPISSVLQTREIKDYWDLNKGGKCSGKTSCQILVNVEGNVGELTQNVCQTTEQKDTIQEALRLILTIMGLGMSVLLVSLYIFYYYQK